MHQNPIGPDHSVNKVVTRNSSSFVVSFNPRYTWDCSTLACLIYTIQYSFKTNILQFLIRFNLQPANAYYIWKVRAIYHRFDGMLPNNPSINLVSRRCSENFIPSELKKCCSWLSEIFTKTKRKEMQEYAIHVTLWNYLHFVWEASARKTGQCLYHETVWRNRPIFWRKSTRR